jgi:hypothetical protein
LEFLARVLEYAARPICPQALAQEFPVLGEILREPRARTPDSRTAGPVRNSESFKNYLQRHVLEGQILDSSQRGNQASFVVFRHE